MFRNDPDRGAVPHIGKGSVDVGRRTEVGEAVIYNGEVDELVKFLGDDDLVVVDKQVYRKTAEGNLAPLAALPVPCILIRPPAGDWFTVTDEVFKTEFAIHVAVAKPTLHATGDAQSKWTATNAPAKKAAPKKAPAKKAAAKK